MSRKQRKKTRLGSYKFVSVLFSITLSLLMIGIFGVVLIQAKMLTSLIRENIEVQVFLSKNLKKSDVDQLLRQMEDKPYVLKKESETVLHFTSKEEAASLFIEEVGEDFTQFLDENPLRDSFTFSVNEEFQTSEGIASIVEELEQLPGVFEVTYMQDMVAAINENLVKVSLVLGTLILILLVTVVILISNTIKLALFSQRFLIRSMQLVGATKGFIRRPFLWRSFLYGALAGLIASGIIFSLLEYGKNFIEGFQLLYNIELLALLFGSLILLGACMSWLSTFRSINKYLNMSLDELY
ncbi:cell division transport system permease protein [Cyclobacterium xiamenense]|uniref:Cell division protein FtsX n=1 Tax=Cyclobacterium xiamenense TaxID=1297121 RepID=A0A1H7BMW7_9BACT|nr:permease-like cell division protein FtsX [Cyclobacterium xiamenense]SEJ78929.1 cell division transport system permease protein [Cyclobacterium xiamenense]